LLQRTHTLHSRPNRSVPASWIGAAQNPAFAARRHQSSNPTDEARRSI
jgi:hypothetical protein